MSELTKCATCVGRRSITGMGGITKKCPDCNGIGWFEDKPLPNQASHAATNSQITDSVTTSPARPTRKKRSTKPKTTRKAA